MSKKKNRNRKRRKLNKVVKKIMRFINSNDDYVSEKLTNFGIKEKFENMNKELQLENYIMRRSEEEKRQRKMRKKYNINLAMIENQKSQSLHGYTDSYGTLLNKDIKKFQHTKKGVNHADCCLCNLCRGNKEVKKEITDPRLKLLLALRDSFSLAVNETVFLDKLEHSDQIYDIFKNEKDPKSEDIEKIIREVEDDNPKAIEDRSLVNKYKDSNIHDLNYYRTKW